MSYPVEPDYIVVELGDGATPEAFTPMCGVESAGINRTVQTNDRFRRDCAKPAAVPKRKVTVTGEQWDVTLNGVVNMAEMVRFKAALGIRRNYRLLHGQYDTQDASATERTGTIYGYESGPAVMTSFNSNVGGEEGTAEVSLAGEDALVWTVGEPA